MNRVLSINGQDISALEVVKAFITKKFNASDQTIIFSILTNCKSLYEDTLTSEGFKEFIENEYIKEEK